ncbi:MAG: hypothetical protein V4525_13220 [Pseudomonadota bacterium]
MKKIILATMTLIAGLLGSFEASAHPREMRGYGYDHPHHFRHHHHPRFYSYYDHPRHREYRDYRREYRPGRVVYRSAPGYYEPVGTRDYGYGTRVSVSTRF